MATSNTCFRHAAKPSRGFVFIFFQQCSCQPCAYNAAQSDKAIHKNSVIEVMEVRNCLLSDAVVEVSEISILLAFPDVNFGRPPPITAKSSIPSKIFAVCAESFEFDRGHIRATTTANLEKTHIQKPAYTARRRRFHLNIDSYHCLDESDSLRARNQDHSSVDCSL